MRMHDLMKIVKESIDPRARGVSHYILSAEPAEQKEALSDILQTAKLDGFGGHCFVAAAAINSVLFANHGELVACYNGPMMDKSAHFFGHVAVKFAGVFWDADGRPKDFSEIESWGMLDPDDDDYDVTPDEAEQVVTKIFDEATVLNMARMRGDGAAEWETAILRAVQETFDLDEEPTELS